jgi:hypothetical protein
MIFSENPFPLFRGQFRAYCRWRCKCLLDGHLVRHRISAVFPISYILRIRCLRAALCFSHKRRSPRSICRTPGHNLRNHNRRRRTLYSRAIRSLCNRGIRTLGSHVPRSLCSRRGHTLLWQPARLDRASRRFPCRRHKMSTGWHPRILPHRELSSARFSPLLHSLLDQGLWPKRRSLLIAIPLLPASLQFSSESFASKLFSHGTWCDLLMRVAPTRNTVAAFPCLFACTSASACPAPVEGDLRSRRLRPRLPAPRQCPLSPRDDKETSQACHKAKFCRVDRLHSSEIQWRENALTGNRSAVLRITFILCTAPKMGSPDTERPDEHDKP